MGNTQVENELAGEDIGVHTVSLGAEPVSFTLRRSRRRTLSITVFPDGSVLVSAPEYANIDEVLRRVRHRGAWIRRARRGFELYRPRTPQRRFVSGETHRFLGRQLRLAVLGEGARRVSIDGSRLLVTGYPRDDHAAVRMSVARWYHRQARTVFAKRLEHCVPLFVSEGVAAPSLTVRRLTRRWGSMSADGRRLTLNTRLVEAPASLIDYVVVHELCHVLVPHHGTAFFDVLEAKLPDWGRRKARLESILV